VGTGWAPARAGAGCDAFPLFPRWLVYSKPFFDDDPYVLEPGGYPNLKAWGAKDPSICSMHPIRLVSAGCWSAVTGVPGPHPALGMAGESISQQFPVHTSESSVWKGTKSGFGKSSCGLLVKESDKTKPRRACSCVKITPKAAQALKGGMGCPYAVPSCQRSLTGAPSPSRAAPSWRGPGSRR